MALKVISQQTTATKHDFQYFPAGLLENTGNQPTKMALYWQLVSSQ
jgi:hypothetical protein